MRAKSAKRLIAENLRRDQGLSYNEINKITGISKSTLSSWLRDIPLTAEQEARLQARLLRNRATFAARALPINRERYRRAREEAYRAGAKIVEGLPEDKAVAEVAFAMLYLGDGSKTSGTVRMGSVSPNILKYFVQALIQLYNIDVNRLSCRLHVIEAAREQEEQLTWYWMERISLPRENFRRTTYDKRSKARTVTDDYHGVCVVTYSDVYLQQRILGLARTYIQQFRHQSCAD